MTINSLPQTLTISLKEAGVILGIRSMGRLRLKAKRGEIPGAFKAGRDWMVYTLDLVAYIRNLYPSQRKTAQVGIKGVEELCRSARKKEVLSIIRDSRSVESECKNLREQLREQRRNSMKKSDGRK